MKVEGHKVSGRPLVGEPLCFGPFMTLVVFAFPIVPDEERLSQRSAQA